MKRYWKVGLFLVAALSIPVGVRAISSYIAASKDTTQIQIVVSSQKANGLTPKDLNIAFLRTLQAYITEDTKQKTRESLRRQGVSPTNLQAELARISSDAAFVEAPTKLAAVRIRAPKWNSVAVVGLVQGKLTRIDCTNSSAEPIATSHGLCGQKIAEVFGTTTR